MMHGFRTRRILAHETAGCREDDFTSLAGLDGAGCEGAAGADVFYVVDYGDVGLAGEDEVAVHAVHAEVLGDGVLGGPETLGDYGAAVDAAGSWRVP